MENNSPLCCCEFIDQHGERNHILACCCNCQELDYCFERLITCHKINSSEMSSVLSSIKDRLRCPGHRGAIPISVKAILPFISPPILVVIMIKISVYVTAQVIGIVILQILTAWYMNRRKARSPILHHWIIASMTYVILMFEISVIPMLEIRFEENLLLVCLATLSIAGFFFTKRAMALPVNENGTAVQNGAAANSGACPVCWVKISPRSFHCNVCHMCIMRYDHHSYWLDCCIGEANQFPFVIGLLFGGLALLYGSMLILTTICRPVFKYGILVPDDCSDVTEQLEMGLCYVCGVYCLSQAPALFAELVYHIWLISFGISGMECTKTGIFACTENIYSRGCCANWSQFLRYGWKRLKF